jgi:glycosyltransferase involved in cell wall biosynthesis
MDTAKAMVIESDAPQSNAASQPAVEVSAVIAVSERWDDLREVYDQYAAELAKTGRSHEVIFILDGPDKDALRDLRTLKLEHPAIQVIALNRPFGEATALAVGLNRARGSVILTLPGYFQVEPGEIRKVLEKLEGSHDDLVVGWRYPRQDSLFNRGQAWVFQRLVNLVSGIKYHDVSCTLRAMKRRVAEEVQLYGDLHRFLPLLAYQRGFKVSEVPVQQSHRDIKRRVRRPGIYLRRLLDILTLFFLLKFTKKPLRFFGLVGSLLSGVGGVIVAYLGLYRLLGLGPIAGRPLLILGVLLIVLGLQLFSVGLLGEIIVFAHARELKDYQIEEILE